MKNTKIALGTEELVQVNGGWDIFSPVKKAVKSVANWTYDTMIKPVGEGIRDYVVEPVFDCLGVIDKCESASAECLTAAAKQN